MKQSLRQQLEEALRELEHKRQTISDYYSRFTKAEEKLKEYERQNMVNTSRALDAEQKANKQLLEIIRWMINPNTAKDPWNELETRKNNLPLNRY